MRKDSEIRESEIPARKELAAKIGAQGWLGLGGEKSTKRYAAAAVVGLGGASVGPS